MANKHAIEIECEKCRANYRLWIPESQIGGWEEGKETNCVMCGAKYLVEKVSDTFYITYIKPEGAVVSEGEEGKEVQHDDDYMPPASEDDFHEEEAVAVGRPLTYKAIVMDADKTCQEMAILALKNLNIEAVISTSEEDCIEKARSGHYQLLVADLHFHGERNGQKIMEAVKEVFPLNVIVLTGKDILDDLMMESQWFDLNVKSFIQKGNPFWGDELKSKAKEALGITT